MVKEEFRNPRATASMIVEKDGKIILVKRRHNPYAGMWALPGGFLEYGRENLEVTATRELKEETCLEARTEDLELLCVNSFPDRDPRGHVIDHVYIVKKYSGIPKAADDAKDLKYFLLETLPLLAFDHLEVVEKYKTWRRKNAKT